MVGCGIMPHGSFLSVGNVQLRNAYCVLNQGWPKFASHLWMRAPDHGFAALVYAPCLVTSSVVGTPIRIEVSTDYPFEGDIQVIITSEQPVRFPLSLRIPGWTHNAVVTVGDDTSKRVQPGTFHAIERE